MPDNLDKGSAVFADRLAELRDLSRYLHDTVAQELVTLAFSFSYLESMLLTDSARAEVESAQRMIDHCCREVRLISSMLAPPLLDDISLKAAIEQLADFVVQETGIGITCELDPSSPISNKGQVLLITAVQSWLALPIRRQAEPAVSIRLRNQGKEIVLEMRMSPPPAGAEAGWSVLREQALALGGRFTVTTEPESLWATLFLPGDELYE